MLPCVELPHRARISIPARVPSLSPTMCSKVLIQRVSPWLLCLRVLHGGFGSVCEPSSVFLCPKFFRSRSLSVVFFVSLPETVFFLTYNCASPLKAAGFAVASAMSLLWGDLVFSASQEPMSLKEVVIWGICEKFLSDSVYFCRLGNSVHPCASAPRLVCKW